MQESELDEYLKGLKVGERVVETGLNCMKGHEGTVYIPTEGPAKGSLCVHWEMKDGVIMGTSVTGGTRRLRDA